MRTLLVCGAVVAVLCFLYGAGIVFSQEPPKAVAAKVGVVDLYDVSQKWKKWIDLADEVQEQMKAGKSKMEEEEKNILAMETKLARSTLAEDSEEWLKERTAVQSARMRLEWLKANETDRLEKLATDYGKGLLAEIESAIKKYGRENGFSLILKIDEISVEGRSWAQMQSYVRFKQVMYYEDGINITPAIIQMLQK